MEKTELESELLNAQEHIDNIEFLLKQKNEKISQLEAKASAYDRLMSGGKKTLNEWANFLGMAVAVDRDGAVWAYPYRPIRYEYIWGSDEEIWPSGAFEMPENLVDFNCDWEDSLTLPDRWEEA